MADAVMAGREGRGHPGRLGAPIRPYGGPPCAGRRTMVPRQPVRRRWRSGRAVGLPGSASLQLYSYGLYSYGLNSCGLCSYGLNSYGLYSYGLYGYGRGTSRSASLQLM